MLKISRMPDGEPEIFASIQGEGVTAGRPSIFVRLAHCNLRCTWCDTAYTWDWNRYDARSSVVDLGVDDVCSRVRSLAGSGDRVTNVVVTGGEPLLQQLELAYLARDLCATGLRIEVETNGTIAPSQALAEYVDQWNVSPKLASSGNALGARNVPEAATWFADHTNAFFKFVIVDPEDVADVESQMQALGTPADRVILMPEGVTAGAITERSRWLAERCMATGYRLGARLHVMLWGAARGR